MTTVTEQKLKACADYFDLKIETIMDLPDNVSGLLRASSDGTYIIINARKSRCDQAFTIAHEMGHYVMHLDRPFKGFSHRLLDHEWKSEMMIEAVKMTRGWIQPFLGLEGEADAWAFILLWRIGAVDELLELSNLYPEKRFMLCFLGAANIYYNFKQPFKNFCQPA